VLVVPFVTALVRRAVAERYASTRGALVALAVAFALYVPALRALLGLAR
jgi:hypothetical protein